MTVFNDLLTAFNALSQWTSLTLANTDLSVNAIGQMLLQLNSVELCEMKSCCKVGRACMKRLDKTKWSETRDETLVRLETVSRPRRRDRDHIPGPANKYDLME